jgi:multidrug transporter EmrE-like cation transporter
MTNYLLLFISISLAVVGQFLMKRGMQIFGTFPVRELLYKIIPMLLNPFVFFGLAAFGLSAMFWLVVLSRLDLSLVYPMVSIGYIAVAVLSWLFLGETVSALRWIGIFIICTGVILISRS